MVALAEGLVLSSLAATSLVFTAAVFGLLFVLLSLALSLEYATEKVADRRWGLLLWLFAVLIGLSGGLASGVQFVGLWRYRDSHSMNARAGAAYTGKQVFYFSNATYVNPNFVGTFRTATTTLCVAPLLGKGPTPLTKVVYWAVGSDCCAVSDTGAGAWCRWWDADSVTGETLQDKNDAFLTAMAHSAIRNGLEVSRSPVWLDVMTLKEHEDRQAFRQLSGLLILIAAPVLWPLLPTLFNFGALLLQFVCGVGPK